MEPDSQKSLSPIPIPEPIIDRDPKMIAVASADQLECCRELRPHPVSYAMAKRLLDIVGSLILLLLLAPIFLVIALAVKITSPGPVFYKSTRVGLCGKKFQFIKFRSMRVGADKQLQQLLQNNEKDGPIFKMKEDPRITPVGRFIRKYSLDELPQLYSVFTGEMSLVGPRPPIPHEVEQYDDLTMTRLSVKPGISCYWQIMGRSNLSFEEWMELDRKYIREMSFWTDLKILLKTPYSVIKGDGAY